ncbi:hypothetical protein SK128_019616 [Halocaridina rubra]|uniref:Uncharacterized protein n=1 Tax=Halocaridina rubra TaxID=373956 RepID=A0AAN9A7C0_HALRR
MAKPRNECKPSSVTTRSRFFSLPLSESSNSPLKPPQDIPCRFSYARASNTYRRYGRSPNRKTSDDTSIYSSREDMLEEKCVSLRKKKFTKKLGNTELGFSSSEDLLNEDSDITDGHLSSGIPETDGSVFSSLEDLLDSEIKCSSNVSKFLRRHSSRKGSASTRLSSTFSTNCNFSCEIRVTPEQTEDRYTPCKSCFLKRRCSTPFYGGSKEERTYQWSPCYSCDSEVRPGSPYNTGMPVVKGNSLLHGNPLRAGNQLAEIPRQSGSMYIPGSTSQTGTLLLPNSPLQDERLLDLESVTRSASFLRPVGIAFQTGSVCNQVAPHNSVTTGDHLSRGNICSQPNLVQTESILKTGDSPQVEIAYGSGNQDLTNVAVPSLRVHFPPKSCQPLNRNEEDPEEFRPMRRKVQSAVVKTVRRLVEHLGVVNEQVGVIEEKCSHLKNSMCALEYDQYLLHMKLTDLESQIHTLDEKYEKQCSDIQFDNSEANLRYSSDSESGALEPHNTTEKYDYDMQHGGSDSDSGCPQVEEDIYGESPVGNENISPQEFVTTSQDSEEPNIVMF